MKQLLNYYSGTKERVGYILPGDEAVEVANISSHPEDSFDVSGEDILKYAIEGGAVATWHTHPGKNANLSTDDYVTFLNFPQLKHYVIGLDGVRCYVVRDGKVFHEA